MELLISAIHQLTAQIRAFELVDPQGKPLPEFSAGAHLDLHLANGLIRQYSLANSSDQRQRYVIAVLNDPHSRGGSRFLHQHYQCGDRLTVGLPRNLFALDHSRAAVLLFAAGIGITPILSMAYSLKAQGRAFKLYYYVHNHASIAFYGNLSTHFASQLHLHLSDQPATHCDLSAVLSAPSADQQLYVCGPTGFMQHIFQAAHSAGWQPSQLHQEHFVAAQPSTAAAQRFRIKVLGYDQIIEVAAEQTASQALMAHGFKLPLACEQGICGSCLTKVLAGRPDHRDVFLTEAEHARNDQFTPCCSRAHGELTIALEPASALASLA
jgi:vanillate O-demethylase ferredoxin subunit